MCTSISADPNRYFHFLLPIATMAVNIKVTPASALVDEKVAIETTGLEPGSTVTIRAQMTERKWKFESHAHYIADLNGKIDFSIQPSAGGSYVGTYNITNSRDQHVSL